MIKIRYMMRRRWFRQPLVIVQIEEDRTAFYNCEVLPYKAWRDARIEDFPLPVPEPIIKEKIVYALTEDLKRFLRKVANWTPRDRDFGRAYSVEALNLVANLGIGMTDD